MRVVQRASGNGFDSIRGYAVLDLVTVVVPSYDHEMFVREAVASILSQTYRPIEVILVDDGSSDRTFEEAVYVLNCSNVPFLAIKKEHQGSHVPGINNGIAMSHGEYISFLASDDIYLPDKLSASVSLLASTDALLVLGKDIQMREDGTLIPGSETNLNEIRYCYERGELFDRLFTVGAGIQFPYLGLVFRKHAFDTLGYFDPQVITEDYDMFVRIALTGIRLAFLPQVVGAHRVGARSEAYVLRVAQSTEVVLRKYAPSLWAVNKRLAYVKIQQGIAWRSFSKRQMMLQFGLGVARYPPVVLYLLKRVGAYLWKNSRMAARRKDRLVCPTLQ